MHTFAITGASGYIGKHLIPKLVRGTNNRIKLLSRSGVTAQGCEAVKGDIREAGSLRGFLEHGCTVIHLAYARDVAAAENWRILDNLLQACRETGIKRFIHCSTAVVVGRADADQIAEDAACQPVTEYAVVKLDMERAVLKAAQGHFDAAVLRPTAVFGPDSANLKKLASDLAAGKRVRNYIKSCLFDARRMNLVHVDNVVAAILFLAAQPDALGGEVFTISDSDAASNNFKDVERVLMRELGIPDYGLPRLPLPSALLGLMLKCLGQESVNPRADYSNRKLLDRGLQRPVRFDDGLLAYARWYRLAKMSA
jgi:nucleoside-diphosphate-sugar epimerase